MARTPTDPTKAQVWITKGLDDLDFEFYFPQGPKGDPGGFATGTLLGTTNLNSITAPGLYRTTSGTNTTLGNNYPVNNNGGILMVTEMSTGYVVQTYESLNGTPQSGSVMYKRQLANGTWTAWRAYNSTRVVDQTAGRVIYQWDDVNNRDQLIYGDTGWRSVHLDQAWIDALSGPGMALAPSNIARVRRQGYMVELSWAYDKTATGSSTAVAAFPVGFRPAQPFNAIGSGSALIFTRMIHQGGTAFLSGQCTAVSTNCHVSVVFSTIDAWPASLPGTVSTTVPIT